MTDKKKVFIATPMYGGMCAGYYTQSLIQTAPILNQKGYDCMFSFMFNESLITRARNGLAHQFLQTDCTHLLFIDSDIKFNPHDIPAMFAADVDIIGGIYPKKEINWDTVRDAMDNNVPNDHLKYHTGSFVVNLVDYAGTVTVPIDQPVEIFNAGTGFLLIKREVFEKLAQHVPSYFSDVKDLGNTIQQRDEIKEFFATSIEPETGRLLSEDYHFCYIWRKIGGKVYAAPWVNLGHMGSYIFEGQLLQS